MTTPVSHPRRRGFSLVELLVVIGIVGLLIGILVPTISVALKKGKRATAAAQLQLIGTALEAYKGDFGDYPRVTDFPALVLAADDNRVLNGAKVLAKALIGPGAENPTGAPPFVNGEDGSDGPGFRIRRLRGPGPDGVAGNADDRLNGKVWGPYLPADKFKLRDPDDPTNASASPARAAMLDGNDKPILYFPARTPKPDVRVATNFADRAEASLFDLNDATVGASPPATPVAATYFRHTPETDDVTAMARFRSMLGDANANGRIDGTETPATDGPFLLWMAGGDGQFGPDVAATASPFAPTRDELKACDDVTNFTIAGQ